VDFIPALRDHRRRVPGFNQFKIVGGQLLVLVGHGALLDGSLFVQPVERLRQFAVTGFGHRLPVLFDSFPFFPRPSESRILSADVRQLGNPRARMAFNWSMAGLLVLSLIPVLW